MFGLSSFDSDNNSASNIGVNTLDRNIGMHGGKGMGQDGLGTTDTRKTCVYVFSSIHDNAIENRITLFERNRTVLDLRFINDYNACPR